MTIAKVHASAANAIMATIAHGYAAITGSIPAILELRYMQPFLPAYLPFLIAYVSACCPRHS